MKRGILYFCQNKTLNLKTLMKNQRLMSLDALRGFDMFFIMGLSGLITAICALAPGEFTDTIALHMKHVSWDGLQHHDTIFPLFLFLAGVSFLFLWQNNEVQVCPVGIFTKKYCAELPYSFYSD